MAAAAPPVAPSEAAEPGLARLIDSHTHLTDRRYEHDLDAVLARSRSAGVVGHVVVGYDLASSEAAVALAQRYPDVWAAVGVHPHNASTFDADTLRRLDRLSRESRVVAIGECGLDYFRTLSPASAQQAAFEQQLDLAASRALPVIVHSREAMAHTLRTMACYPLAHGGVMHCFDGTIGDAMRAVELNLHVSAAGPLTYRKDTTLADALAAVPDNRVLVETDCPYLSPVGHRGERNEPAHVTLVVQALARARGVSFNEVARHTTTNAGRLFGLPLGSTGEISLQAMVGVPA